MKKVLMILFEFSPTGYTGSFRATSFVKYLRHFGWEPIIITVEQDNNYGYLYANEFKDPNYPQDLKIYRTKVLKKFFINEWGFRWLPYLIPKLIKVIKQEKPDLVYITCPPYYELLVGYIIKKWFGIPYILDYRDGWLIGWSYDEINFSSNKKSLKGHLQDIIIAKQIQSHILANASRAIFVTDTLKQSYIDFFPNIPKNKFITITNGLDFEEVKSVRPKELKKFTILLTGRIQRSNSFNLFLQALNEIIEQYPVLSENIQFLHIGPLDNWALELTRAFKLGRCTSYLGMKAHYEAISYAKGANLLLVQEGTKQAIPVKLLEYLVCKKPILVLATEGGETEKIAKSFPACCYVESIKENVPRIKEIIMDIYNNNRVINLKPEYKKLSAFSRKSLTSSLSKVFDEAIIKYQKLR